jgi:myosin-3
LPQLFVNCFNEQLQYHYLQRVFSWECLDVREEELEYQPFGYYDNKKTLDQLLCKSEGIFTVIDEASKTGHDGKYVIDFIQNLEAKFVGVSGQSEFSVAHYTGQVCYNAREMPDKNRDFLPPEIIETLRLSDNSIVKLLFTNKLDKTGNLIISLDKDDEINTRRYKFPSEKSSTNQYSQIKRMRTCVHTFKALSLEVLKELSIGSGSGGTHFIRCIRCDLKGEPENFDYELVKQQVRALAVTETVRARQIGYPHRIPFQEFLRRYQFLAFDFDENVEVNRDNCRLLLIRLKMEGWNIGKSKVFLKYYNEEYLARLYETQVKKIIKIQSILRRFLAKCMVAKQMKDKERHYSQ